MTPWVTPHSIGLATNQLSMFLKLSKLSSTCRCVGGLGGGGVIAKQAVEFPLVHYPHYIPCECVCVCNITPWLTPHST